MRRAFGALTFLAVLGMAALVFDTSAASAAERRGVGRPAVGRGVYRGGYAGYGRGYYGGYRGGYYGGYYPGYAYYGAPYAYSYPYYDNGYYNGGYYTGYGYPGYYAGGPGFSVGLSGVGFGFGWW
jgi:hypothetical protein